MTKKIKNLDTVEQIWGGVGIQPSSFYSCNDQAEAIKFSQDDNFLSALMNGLAEVYNYDSKVNGFSEALSFLKGEYQIDSENAQFTRLKLVPTGWTYGAIGVDFETSTLSSLKIFKGGANDTSINKTIKFYDSSDSELTSDLTTCVKTVITLEPTYDYYLICGQIAKTTNHIHCDAVGVPDIPANMGGSKYFAQNLDLARFDGLKTDGKAPKLLQYNATYHTNKFKFSFYHEAGVQEEISVILELYRL